MFKTIIRAVNKVYAKERLDDVAYLLVHKGSFVYIFSIAKAIIEPYEHVAIISHLHTL